MRTSTLASLLLCLTVLAEAPVAKSRAFAGYEWMMQVPVEFTEEKVTRADRTDIVGYTAAPRADGTRPLLQVSAVDFANLPGEAPSDFIEEFAKAMIGGIEERRTNWKVQRSDVEVGGRRMIRFEWSGVSVPAADGASVAAPMRGIMLVGMDGNIGFMLGTQDTEEHAERVLPQNERALRTFVLRKAGP